VRELRAFGADWVLSMSAVPSLGEHGRSLCRATAPEHRTASRRDRRAPPSNIGAAKWHGGSAFRYHPSNAPARRGSRHWHRNPSGGAARHGEKQSDAPPYSTAASAGRRGRTASGRRAPRDCPGRSGRDGHRGDASSCGGATATSFCQGSGVQPDLGHGRPARTALVCLRGSPARRSTGAVTPAAGRVGIAPSEVLAAAWPSSIHP
jgi:hypothetical protein